MIALPTDPPGVDHRRVVARERRARMQARLLDATLEIWADDGVSEAAVIRDVVEAAGVSRATFYKHFSSLDAAAIALGGRLSDRMTAELVPIQHGIDDPLVVAAIGIQVFLWRGTHDPTWGRFVSRHAHVAADGSRYSAHVGAHLMAGRDEGHLHFTRLDTALALSNGAMKEGVAELARGVDDAAGFIISLATMILAGLCGDNARAERAVDAGAAHIRCMAPALYQWWPQPS